MVNSEGHCITDFPFHREIYSVAYLHSVAISQQYLYSSYQRTCIRNTKLLLIPTTQMRLPFQTNRFLLKLSPSLEQFSSLFKRRISWFLGRAVVGKQRFNKISVVFRETINKNETKPQYRQGFCYSFRKLSCYKTCIYTRE